MTSPARISPVAGSSRPPTPSDVREEGLARLKPRRRWLKRHDVWFRHPVCRILSAVFITVCDFIMHGLDPIQDSHAPCGLPVAGNVITMVLNRYPAAPGAAFVKVALWFIFMLAGLLLGRKVLHQWLLRDKMKINMFEEDQGSFTVMGVTALIFMFASSHLYNALVVPLEPGALAVTSSLEIQYRTFGKIAQCFTWLGDLLTLVVVTDTVLQDKTKFPRWCTGGKRVWNEGCGGYFRVVFVWSFVVVSTTTVYTILLYVTTEVVANQAGTGTGSTADLAGMWSDELLRCILVCLIATTDLFIVFQDWEFPTFSDDLEADVMVPGTFDYHLECKCCAPCVRRCGRISSFCEYLHGIKFFHVKITGKWLQYGVLLVIFCFDCNLLKNQVVYTPGDFGQYVCPPGSLRPGGIVTITDTAALGASYWIYEDGAGPVTGKYKDVGFFNYSYVEFATRHPNASSSGCFTGVYESIGVCRDNTGAPLGDLTDMTATQQEIDAARAIAASAADSNNNSSSSSSSSSSSTSTTDNNGPLGWPFRACVDFATEEEFPDLNRTYTVPRILPEATTADRPNKASHAGYSTGAKAVFGIVPIVGIVLFGVACYFANEHQDTRQKKKELRNEVIRRKSVDARGGITVQPKKDERTTDEIGEI